MKGWNVIFNPSAGSVEGNGEGGSGLYRLGKLNLMATSNRGDAFRFARQIRESGGGRIVVMGGDGTLNEVVNGLAPNFEGIEMAVLPGGTGNDFCRGLKISNEIEEAVEALRGGMEPKLVDVGRVRFKREERFFLNTSAGGFSVLVNQKLDELGKKNWGSLAYYISAIQTLPDLQSFHFEARSETGTLESEAYAWVVANGRYIAGGVPIAPRAELDDGLLDLVLIPSLPVSELPSLISELLLETEESGSVLLRKQVARVEIKTRPSYEFNLDGEVTGSTPVTYEVLPSVLQMYQPV